MSMPDSGAGANLGDAAGGIAAPRRRRASAVGSAMARQPVRIRARRQVVARLFDGTKAAAILTRPCRVA